MSPACMNMLLFQIKRYREKKKIDDEEMESLYFWVGGTQSRKNPMLFVRVIIKYKRNTS